jgi:L,D-peptidoglycan transpeptidase YkuD (ErfK/YbiS/YcfS/YnhG family)
MQLILQKSLREVEWKGEVLPCSVGKNGIGTKNQEGDQLTPRGIWRLESVLYRQDRVELPPSILPCFPILPKIGWSDDPKDPFYNQIVPLPSPFSHEELNRSDSIYDLLIVTSFNRFPIVPGRGSAIFIHIARENEQGFQPTAGCLGLRSDSIKRLIQEADLETYWVVPLSEHFGICKFESKIENRKCSNEPNPPGITTHKYQSNTLD